MKLGFRAEQRVPAAHAVINAVLIKIVVLARKSEFRILFSGDAVLRRCELLLPFLGSFGDFFTHDNSSSVSRIVEIHQGDDGFCACRAYGLTAATRRRCGACKQENSAVGRHARANMRTALS